MALTIGKILENFLSEGILVYSHQENMFFID